MEIDDVIVCDAKICSGEPVFKGTRVHVKTILASLAEGDSIELLLKEYPSLKRKQLLALVSFAADAAVKKLSRRKPSKAA